MDAYGDRLALTDREAAVAAYRRAGELQRAFASGATAGGEGIARMMIAEEFSAKAHLSTAAAAGSDAGPRSPSGVPGEVIVVRPSRLGRDGMFAAIDAVLVLILVRVWTGSPDSTVTVTVMSVVFGGLLVLVTVIWWLLRRHPARIEVSTDRMRYVNDRQPAVSDPDFVRADGDELRFTTQVSGKSSMMVLTQTATGIAWKLPFFSQKSIVAAAQQRQWRVAGHPPSGD